VLVNDGDGALSAAAAYPASHEGFDDFEVGDVSGDGRDDLVVKSGQGLGPNLSVVPQLSGGGFGTATSYSVAPTFSIGGTGVGDVTGDGRGDVVLGRAGNSRGIAVLAQSASGGLSAAVSHAGFDGADAVADVDLDGRADVVALHDAYQAGIFRQQPDGTLAREEIYAIGHAPSHRPHGLAVGDVTGDGSPDIVAADRENGVVVLRNVQLGQPQPGHTHARFRRRPCRFGVALVDSARRGRRLDADGLSGLPPGGRRELGAPRGARPGDRLHGHDGGERTDVLVSRHRAQRRRRRRAVERARRRPEDGSERAAHRLGDGGRPQRHTELVPAVGWRLRNDRVSRVPLRP
jgi:hypothetical protein